MKTKRQQRASTRNITPVSDHQATSKERLIRDQDVQVLHGLNTFVQAQACLNGPLFRMGWQITLPDTPEVRIDDVMLLTFF